MDENFYNLSDLFKSPFGPNHPRNWEGSGPYSYENIVPFPNFSEEYQAFNRNIKSISPYQRERIEREQMKKQQIEIKESICNCGKAMMPIVVEISFRLKNPEVTYVGDICMEYCPDCQDEQFLAMACKEASHKFLTNLTSKKK